MAKQFKDFTFLDKKLSSLNVNYMSVDFDNNQEINLALERDMTVGETNRYRTEANYFYDAWSNNLEFELDIIKNPCKYTSTKDMKISEGELRDITKWLTSSHLPQWIKFDYSDDRSVTNYYGWFSNIETFVSSGNIYGLKLHFKCTTPFGFTDEIVKSTSVSNSYSNLLITNSSDGLEDYCYPKIHIKPKANCQVFFLNQNDMTTLTSGTLTKGNAGSYYEALLNSIESYAKLNGYTIRYTGTGVNNIVGICDDTAVQFYLVDTYDNETKCTAFYKNDSTKEYKIITGGFMYMSVYKNLEVDIDTSKLIINDSIGRMITYDKLGINDVDQMYWFRLISGNNSILVYGNCEIDFKYREARKAGE